MKEYEERYCIICGEAFIPIRCTQVTCASQECKKERQRLQQIRICVEQGDKPQERSE